MTPDDARSVAGADDGGAMAGLVVAKWLRLAATPSFSIMALLTVALDSSQPNALCLTAGSLQFGGMAPMYLLMAIFHSMPWLNLVSRRPTLLSITDQGAAA
ncbi:hypothetical protein [Bradyrhizobium sp.]|jgi:hypothetical protein|uniref:hypothetical protein n=1 Tax=Bradyrhizobium sp. TaxID=376 RepID=UPI003C28D87B